MISAASSSVVTMTTRTAMSIRASVGMSEVGGRGWGADLRPPTCDSLLTDLSDEAEHRHVHGDDDAADGHAEESDEHRLEKLHQAGHRHAPVIPTEPADLRQPCIELAGLLAHCDQLHDHRQGNSPA